jgi:hypothetical protein
MFIYRVRHGLRSFLLLVATLLAACDRERDPGLNLRAPWWTSPDVIICDTVPVDTDRIIRSLDIWAELSDEYAINSVSENVQCDGFVHRGQIRIDVADEAMLDKLGWDDDVWFCKIPGTLCDALAYTYFYQTDERHSQTDDLVTFENPPESIGWGASVHLKKGNRKETIAHELGHAFGWLHTDEDDNHLMSASSDLGHNYTDGLEHYRDLTYLVE